MKPLLPFSAPILPWLLTDSEECNIYQWLVIATMTIDGRVSGVPSQILREPISAPMKSAMRPTLYRLQAILMRLSRGERVTANHMAEDLEVSVRTVARDIDYLINTLHVPMSYHYSKKSYVLDGPLPSLLRPPDHMPGIEPSALLGDE